MLLELKKKKGLLRLSFSLISFSNITNDPIKDIKSFLFLSIFRILNFIKYLLTNQLNKSRSPLRWHPTANCGGKTCCTTLRQTQLCPLSPGLHQITSLACSTIYSEGRKTLLRKSCNTVKGKVGAVMFFKIQYLFHTLYVILVWMFTF